MILLVGLVFALIVSGCTAISAPGGGALLPLDDSTAADESMAADDAMVDDGSAMATISTRSLRVRGEPSETAEVVAAASEGESYKVMQISDDGQWVQIATANAPDGSGWVSANFVTVKGELTGTADEATGDEAGADAATDEAATDEVATDEVATDEVATDETAVEPPEAGMALIVTDGTRLRVRAEPNTDAEIAGYVHNGELYSVAGLNDDGAWVQIAGSADGDNPDGGWVSAEFVVLGE